MNPDDEALESVLKEGLSRPELPDGGFTARVLATLAREDAMAHYRAWVALGWSGAVTGAGAALWACVPWSVLMDASSALGQSPSGLPPYAWTTFALIVTLMSGLAGWYVVESARQP
jgi:hypothetical protein